MVQEERWAVDGRESVERVWCVSLPQSAVLTAPSSEGAMGSGGMRSGEMGGGRGAIMLYDNIEI